MGRGGIHDDCRRAQLRRTGGNDAASGRAVRLSARGTRAVVGLSLRLDAISGDSDRHDCCGRRGFRQVSRSFLPCDFFFQLDCASLEGSADPVGADGSGQHGRGNQYAEPGGYFAGDLPLGGQYLWGEDRGADPECVHRGQGLGAAGTGLVRLCPWAQCAGAGGELQREFLAGTLDWSASTRCKWEWAARL